MGRRHHRGERQGPLRSIVGTLTAKVREQNSSRSPAQDPRDYRNDRGFGGPQIQYELPRDSQSDRGMASPPNQYGPQYEDSRDSKSDRGMGNQPNQHTSQYEEPRDNDRDFYNQQSQYQPQFADPRANDRGFGGQQSQYQPQYDNWSDYRNERRSRRRQKSPGPIHSIIEALASKGSDQYQSRSLYDNQNDYRSDRGYRRRRRSSSSSGSSRSPGPIRSIVEAFANRNGGQSQSRAPYDNSDSYIQSRRYQHDHPQFQPQYSNTNNYSPYSTGFEAQQAQRGPQYDIPDQNTYNPGFGSQQTDFRPQSDGPSPFADNRDFKASPRAGVVQNPDFTDSTAMPPPYESSISQPSSESRLPYSHEKK